MKKSAPKIHLFFIVSFSPFTSSWEIGGDESQSVTFWAKLFKTRDLQLPFLSSKVLMWNFLYRYPLKELGGRSESLLRKPAFPWWGRKSSGNCSGSSFCPDQVLLSKNFHSRPGCGQKSPLISTSRRATTTTTTTTTTTQNDIWCNI